MINADQPSFFKSISTLSSNIEIKYKKKVVRASSTRTVLGCLKPSDDLLGVELWTGYTYADYVYPQAGRIKPSQSSTDASAFDLTSTWSVLASLHHEHDSYALALGSLRHTID